MPEDTRNLALDWQSLVTEAILRRKAEGLTQREHAALAGVSAPTLIAFDRGETSLTLTKAFDILRVVGLLVETNASGAQEKFVKEAYERWLKLTENLSTNSPARFSNGWWRVDYSLNGDLRPFEPYQFLEILSKAVVRHSGWPPFWFPQRSELEPREVDGVIECWLAPSEAGVARANEDPAHCDFWRGAPSGRMFLMRGYQEDSQETFSPGAIFDSTLPIWRLGEVLLHAASLARLVASDIQKVSVDFRAMYTGLRGRELRSWANPLGGILLEEGQRAKSDEALLEATLPISTIESQLSEHIQIILTPLYERFGITSLSNNFVKSELNRMMKSSYS